jgi:hypothetical protein
VTAEPLLIVDGVPMTSPDPGVSVAPAASDLPNSPYGSSPLSSALNNIPYNTIDFIEVLMDADASIYGVRGEVV